MPLDAGTRVGRYTIIRLLAKGGMAEVYRADQELTNGITRKAAVKVIRPEYSESEDFRAMFLDEARTACTLSHANIVHIYEVGETDDGLLYMAMELVPGEALATINRTLRERDERFSDEALFAIGVSTASALEAVHRLTVEDGKVNLVHRDVSPHNLLLSSTGSLKLIDFGIAKAATNRNLTLPGVTKGKAGYFSPEQALGRQLDGRSDLFSLGVLLYKLASGATPFDEHSGHAERHAALVRGQWKPLRDVFSGLPAGLYAAVDRALRVDPEERFEDARQMREALERAAVEAGTPVTSASLRGYVDDEGEITAGGGRRSSVFPALKSESALRSPRPSRPTRSALVHTDRVAAPKPRSSKPMVLGIAFLAAVVIGVFGVLVMTTREPSPAPRTSPRVETPKPLVLPKVAPVVVLPVRTVDAGVVEVVAKREPVRTPLKDAVVHKSPMVAKAPEVLTPPTPPAPPPREEAIPPGEGTLRISASKPAVVRSVTVGREDWGGVPVNKQVSTGRYTVVMLLSDGRKSPPGRVEVLPEHTTKLFYDVDSERWDSSR